VLVAHTLSKSFCSYQFFPKKGYYEIAKLTLLFVHRTEGEGSAQCSSLKVTLLLWLHLHELVSFTALDAGNNAMLNMVSQDMNLEGEKVDINFSAEGYHSSFN
jgi:hypothetical protein